MLFLSKKQYSLPGLLRLLFRMRSGYTLIELVVGISVFVISVSIATAAFISALRTERAAANLMALNSNTSLMIEQLMREVRTGYDIQSVSESVVCAESGLYSRLDFFNSSRGNQVSYRWNDELESLERMECVNNDCSSSEFESLVASDMRVKKMCFDVLNENSVPRVAVFMTVGSKNPDLDSKSVNIETVVSARIIPSLDL